MLTNSVVETEKPAVDEALDCLQDMVASEQDEWYQPNVFYAAVALLTRAGRSPGLEGRWLAVMVERARKTKEASDGVDR